MVLWTDVPSITWNYPLIPLVSMLEVTITLIISSVPTLYTGRKRGELRGFDEENKTVGKVNEKVAGNPASG